MEVIKRKIYLENSTDRVDNSPTWGQLTATTFYLNIPLVQTIDDMGLFTDVPYIQESNSPQYQPDYTILSQKLAASGITFPFMVGINPLVMTGLTETDDITLRFPSNTEASYYNFINSVVTGSTDSKIEELKTYNYNEPYIPGFDMVSGFYTNYQNILYSGVSRVVYTGEPMVYVFDTKNDANIGTNNQIFGLLYTDFSGISRTVTIDGITDIIPRTDFRYIGEGFNETNTSLSALTKEEYLFGIISTPEVKNDVFIDRGVVSVMDRHLRLSEIRDLDALVRYGNGYYNVNKQ